MIEVLRQCRVAVNGYAIAWLTCHGQCRCEENQANRQDGLKLDDEHVFAFSNLLSEYGSKRIRLATARTRLVNVQNPSVFVAEPARWGDIPCNYA